LGKIKILHPQKHSISYGDDWNGVRSATLIYYKTQRHLIRCVKLQGQRS